MLQLVQGFRILGLGFTIGLRFLGLEHVCLITCDLEYGFMRGGADGSFALAA